MADKILPATQKPASHAPVVIAEIALCLPIHNLDAVMNVVGTKPLKAAITA